MSTLSSSPSSRLISSVWSATFLMMHLQLRHILYLYKRVFVARSKCNTEVVTEWHNNRRCAYSWNVQEPSLSHFRLIWVEALRLPRAALTSKFTFLNWLPPSDVNHKAQQAEGCRLLTAIPSIKHFFVLFTTVTLRNGCIFNKQTYRQLNMHSYIKVFSVSTSAPQTASVKKLSPTLVCTRSFMLFWEMRTQT